MDFNGDEEFAEVRDILSEFPWNLRFTLPTVGNRGFPWVSSVPTV